MVSSLGCDEPAVNVRDVLWEEAVLMVLRQVTDVLRGVMLRGELMFDSQLIEVDLHVVL